MTFKSDYISPGKTYTNYYDVTIEVIINSPPTLSTSITEYKFIAGSSLDLDY
jgi:hypothetical protein